MRANLLCVVMLTLGGAPALAAPKPAAQTEPAPPAADLSGVQDKLAVFSDGKKHYVALVMSADTDQPTFWSDDGKHFYQLRVFGGGGEGDEKDLKALSKNFWEPRVNAPYQASLDYSNKEGGPKFTVQCNERKTNLTQLPAAEAKSLVAGGQFFKARWNHRAYALARDNTGKYYYVDKQREPEESKSFRLWTGPKGGLKAQKMLNVVSDSQGDIFSTKHGELRLILGKQETSWIANDHPTKLTWVPVEDNHVMIYTDLGVYTGEPLGTPCDDL